jgi:hypothetical protein
MQTKVDDGWILPTNAMPLHIPESLVSSTRPNKRQTPSLFWMFPLFLPLFLPSFSPLAFSVSSVLVVLVHVVVLLFVSLVMIL